MAAFVVSALGTGLADRMKKHLHGVRTTIANNFHLGFTAFGGPPVHFQIFHKKFVDKLEWIDERTYQELFAISQALPGPASTKMLFCINAIQGGALAGIVAFLLWSLPGAIAMYGLSLGVAKIGDQLPSAVYALLSGLNAATVGIIALAAVQLARNAISDRVTRLIVFLSGSLGMLYTALWYFPVLMAVAGLATIGYDFGLLRSTWDLVRRRRRRIIDDGVTGVDSTAIELGSRTASTTARTRFGGPTTGQQTTPERTGSSSEESPERTSHPNTAVEILSWRTGSCVIAGFMALFVTIMVLRATLKSPPRIFLIFSNFYLAGTIIFGGGPVVIPLLREYIVAEGWVSPRDFLLGLALIQSFPGPNFNFAVYLGALAVQQTATPSFAGALIAFLGIFLPGMVIVYGFMGLWQLMRSRRWVISLLRGVNAAAVGLVYTAVYKLWQIGFIDPKYSGGSPLGSEPWFVAITATSFVGGEWFGLPAPLAILLGGVMGMLWYAVTQR